MTHPLISAATLQKLAQFDTPTICNVIELFEVRPYTDGYMDGRIRAAFPELPPIVGFASTATFRSSFPPKSASYVGLDAQLEQFASLPGPAVLVFQDLDDPAVAATFGEVMCSSYKAFGSAGLITSGAGRDLLQVRALEYPVFTGSTICSHGYCQTLEIGLPVRVGGLVVNNGDLLHADANGVTNIPLELATEIADVASELVAAENHILDYVKSPGPRNLNAFRVQKEAFATAMASLRRQVARNKK